MSLFTFKELWSVDCGEGFSSFSPQSLVVANVDNASDNEAKFVLGSLTGLLRIIGTTPKTEFNSDSPTNNQGKTVILTELNLGHPILQIEADIFVGGSEKLNLAILHPQKLAVYAISKLSGQVEHGSQYKVESLYEHQLKRHAFNMCCGSFGHGTSDSANDKERGRKANRKFICVQSLDGTLSFFEQELFTFSRYLPGFLLPGQLAYVPSWDAFLTITSWKLVCFKYASLAMAKDDPYQQQFQDTSVGKRMVADWVFTIGEECIGDIQVLCTDEPSTTSAIVCTFRNIFGFGEGGQILWSKRLDYQISYFTSYLLPVSNTENECITLTVSSNEPYTCYVYNGTSLRWAAKLSFSPVHLSRVSFTGMEGAMVILSHEGKMVFGCLGTVPSLFIAPPVQARDLDYEAAEKELYELRKAITAAGEQNVTANKDSTVEIKLEFEGQKSKWIESNGLEVISLIGVLKLVCHLKVNDVRVTINTPKPITCSPDSVFIGDIIGRHNYQVEFFVDNEAIPSDLQCDVFVFYLSDSGAPHFVQKCGIKIPLFIVAKAHNKLEKDGDSKITFLVNKPAVNLPTLFNDFEWKSDGNPGGISFLLYGGETVSLLSSTKMSNSASSKYRIQSTSLAAVYLVFRDFVDRLQRKLGREKQDLVIEPSGFDNEIPLLSDYFSEIDAHTLRRRRDIQMKEELSDRAAQLRAIQRRLLIRFRDKNPTPLTQLEILFEGSLDQVGDCLNFIEENDMEKQKTKCRLSGATKLLLELIALKRGCTTDDSTLLANALSPYIWNFAEEYGWEESVYTALTYIKSQVIVTQSFSNLDPLKLKKVIKSSLEKACKGSVCKRSAVNQSSQNEEQSSSNEKLVGNEIVERMTSARGRMARRLNPTLASIPEPVIEGDDINTNTAPQKNWSENSNGRGESPNLELSELTIKDWEDEQPTTKDAKETSPTKYNESSEFNDKIPKNQQERALSDDGFW